MRLIAPAKTSNLTQKKTDESERLHERTPVACSTGVVDGGVWLRIRQCPRCALFRIGMSRGGVTTAAWLKLLVNIVVMVVLFHKNDGGYFEATLPWSLARSCPFLSF
jgi:hypothetical protein